MKIHSYHLSSGAALLCLMLAAKPCLAADLSTTASSGYDYGSAATGIGINPHTNSANPNTPLGNTNVPFDSWAGLSNNNSNPFVQDINSATGDPYDETPIHELNNLNNGQQIFDQYANNGRSMPSAASIGTWQQTPSGRDPIAQSSSQSQTGLLPTTTTILAGAIPNASGIVNALNTAGIHSFTEIPFEKRYEYSYGFNTSPNWQQVYSGLAHPSNPNFPVPSTPSGGWLPPTSTGAVDLNIAEGNNLRILPPRQSTHSHLTQ